ncbi:MAG: hypothetical protein V1875_02680 [Candidatus Altiarchaeota archaeon]
MRFLAFLALAALVCGCLQQGDVEEVAFSPLPDAPAFRTDLVSCSYDRYPDEGKARFSLFFRIIETAETPTNSPAWVCLEQDISNRPHCIVLNRQYRASEVLWGEVNWTDGRRGQMWSIDSDPAGRIDVEYALYYTEDQGDLEGGAVRLYSGSTESCRLVTH